jgi:hypothetical protein
MVNRKWTYTLAVVFTAAVLVLAGCAGPTTPAPVATSESRIANGFQFTVTVSNVQPRLGESIVISADLLNLYNATIPVDQLGGTIALQIADEQGNIVWAFSDVHSGTTLTVPAGTGFSWDFTRTWTAATNAAFTTPITAGNYTLSATAILGLAVTPIRITVSG